MVLNSAVYAAILFVVPQLCYGLDDQMAELVVEANARVHEDAEADDEYYSMDVF